MKIIILTYVFLMYCANIGFAQNKFNLEDFSIPLEQITSSPNHIWVNSGYSTVSPKYLSVMGVRDFYSPPLGTKEFVFSVELKADSISISDSPNHGKGDVGLLYSSGTWYPHKIVRTGTYHHLKGNKLYSLFVTSELVPLYGQSGFIEKITIKNRSNTSVNIEANYFVQPGKLLNEPLSKWGFSIYRWDAPGAQIEDNNTWSNDRTKIILYDTNKTAELQPNESLITYTAIIAKDISEEFPENINFQLLERQSLEAWTTRLKKYTKNIPALESDIPGLRDYYYRSIVSGLICIWENDSYLLNPHIATCGMDGGAMCTYHWDVAGYAPKMMTLMLDSEILKIANQMVKSDLEKYNAYALDGSGIGGKYSYSSSAFTNLVSQIFQFLGPDKDLYNAAKKIILNDEKRENKNTNLIDYGEQHNLLEMRSSGWEHYVVSPNAERVQALNDLASMGPSIGESNSETKSFIEKAQVIRKSIQTNLWDENRKWFASVYPNGFRDYVYSIQVFDAIRAGVCSAEMETAILKCLSENSFLGKYGVSSISKQDTSHYEVIDTDWSGGGSYTGDGPQLALILYERDQKDLAWDILKRHFWMGENLIYYPQEIFVNKPSTPDHKRANVVAGLIGAETILFGLVGFQTNYENELIINPNPVDDGNIQIKGFKFWDNDYDVELSTENMKIHKNGVMIYDGKPCKMKLK